MAGDSTADKAPFLVSRLLMAALIFFANNLRAEDVVLTVNIKKPVALTSDKFLSYTLDPMVILTGDALIQNPQRSINMAKALAPAYVRIGGPRSNSYVFERSRHSQGEQDPGFTFTEANWIGVHHWAETAGLDVLACIAPQHSENSGRDPGWDSRNALDLISFSDHIGFNTSWQLGYECQTRCDVAGIDIGRDVMRLRSMLDAFPRYSRSVIAGPDVVTYRTRQQQQYLQDYLNAAGTALSAITWHPDFAGITLDTEGVSMHHDNLAIDKDGLYKVVGRLISKKPLWLAESKPEECKKQFLGALVWTRRLGNAARFGAQVLMRQPDNSDLFQPTPDYWVSLLHKNLVGREVLDTKIATGNRTHVHFYCQCTKPSSRYDKGSLTVFGINLTPAKVVAGLKGVKIKTLHKYILLPGFDAENRMFSETVLLNNEPLNLVNEQELPEIKPAISSNSKGVNLKLPSGGIGFWVIPGLKIKSCGGLEEDNTDKMLLKKLTKRLEETESDEDAVNSEDGEEESDDNVSAEDRRYSTKSSKNKRRRKHRYSEEDDAEKRYRRYEAKMDLERLEKLLRKRDNHDDRKSPRGRTAYFGFEEKIDDDENTGEAIRAKLEEYKKRLKEYENGKKHESKVRGKESDDDTIDSEKVVEAMKLISKMENAMKSVEKGDEEITTDNLNSGGSSDLTSDLSSPIKSGNSEDMFLDELLKSEKIRRTSVPSKIEDQLRAIYQMLAEEKARRQRNLEAAAKLQVNHDIEEPLQTIDDTLSRTRRDTDKKFGDDPLGLRKEGLFRKRPKNEDVKDRRTDRRNRRKDKDERKDGQPVIFDPRATASDSNENNFYGFHQREPLKGFPEGDVFLTTGTSSEEAATDYDYVKDDDDGPEEGRSIIAPRVSEPALTQAEQDDATWIEDENTHLSHVPIEFFEQVNMPVAKIQNNLKDYGELWEAESLGEKGEHFNDGDEAATVEKIIQERRPDAREDKKAKETAVRKIIGYYEDPRSYQSEGIDYVDSERPENSRIDAINSQRTPMSEMRNQRRGQQPSFMPRKRVKDLTSGEYQGFTDFDSMHFGRVPISSMEDTSSGLYDAGCPVPHPVPRTKRSTDDLESIMDREMIFQDDNNLKDCECRSIRGTRLGNRRGDRAQRIGLRQHHTDRLERRRQRVREGPPSTRPGGRFDEDYMHTTRSKRQVVLAKDEVDEVIDGDSNASSEDSSDGSGSAGDEEEPRTMSNESISIEDHNDEGVSYTTSDGHANDDDIVNEELLTVKSTKISNIEESNRIFGANIRNADLAMENEDSDFKTDNIVKRHNEDSAVSKSSIASSTVTEDTKNIVTESPVEQSTDFEASTVHISESDNPTEMLTNKPKRDSLFLESSSKSAEDNSTTDGKLAEGRTTRFAKGLDEPFKDIQASSAELKESVIGLRSVGTETKIGDSETAVIANSDESIQKKTKAVGEEDDKNPTTATLPNLLGNPELAIVRNETNNSENASDNAAKLKTDETKIENSNTKSETATAGTKDASKPSKVTKDAPRNPRKTSQKSKQSIRVVDPSKAREARLAARSEALLALRKENESRKAKKSLEAATKLLSSDNAKIQNLQKKRNDQLEKLREKLRLKRAKIVQEYRDELLDDLDSGHDGEERNLKRREILDMINNDDDLREIVDREKLNYLLLNKPIDYEAAKDKYSTELEQQKKYVPEAVDMVRTHHDVRERKVHPRSKSVRQSKDPKILVYGDPEEISNAEAVKTIILKNNESTGHKMKRRAGNSFDADFESLENPMILHSAESIEDESNESGEHSDSIELTKAISALSRKRCNRDDGMQDSSDYDDSMDAQRYRRNQAKSVAISESQEVQLKDSQDPSRVTKDSVGNPQYMCLKENSGELSDEDTDKLFKLVKENDHYMATPVHETKISKEKHVSKKKYLKDSDYEQNPKYKCPKYARLATENINTSERKNSANSRKDLEDYHVKTFDENLLQEIVKNSKKSSAGNNNDPIEFGTSRRRATKGSIEEGKVCPNQRKKKYRGQLPFDLESMDDLDLDEALNSSKYELLMLIPVRNQKISRQKRQIGNEIIREDKDSVLNVIPMETKVKKIEAPNENNKTEKTLETTDQSVTNDFSNSISESSKSIIIESSDTDDSSTESKDMMLDGDAVDEIIYSVPRVITAKKINDDGGIPALIEQAMPKIEASVTDGLNKARHISESFEKFINGFDNKFDQNQLELEIENERAIKSEMIGDNDCPISQNFFSSTFRNLKKCYDFLSGMVHIFLFK